MIFTKSVKYFKFVQNTTRIMDPLHEHLCAFMRIFGWNLPIMRNFSEKFVRKIKTRNLCSIIFFFCRKFCPLWDGVEKYCTARPARDYNIIRSRKDAIYLPGHIARMGERRGVYRILVGESERMRPLGRPRHKWDGNIKMDLQEMRCEDVDWIDLAQDRDRWRAFVSAVMNLWVP